MERAVKPFSQPPTLVDEVVRVLEERIVRGEISPGERLIEEDVAAEFRVSRPPVREAFRLLQRDGLVEIAPRRGARVASATPTDIGEIYACRIALEGMAARLAAQHIDKAELAELRGILGRMRAAQGSGKLDQYFALNVEFHEFVGAVSGNARLRELLAQLGKQVLRMRHTSLSLPGRMKYSYELHRRIVAAFEKRDAAAAEDLTRKLIGEAGAALVTHLRIADQRGETERMEESAQAKAGRRASPIPLARARHRARR